VTEPDRSNAHDVERLRLREPGQEIALLGRDLLSRPCAAQAPDVVLSGSPLRGPIEASDELAVRVSADDVDVAAELHEAFERLARERSRRRITTNEDDVGRRLLNVAEHGLERWKIAVDVIDRRYPHGLKYSLQS
jgi:hypothetical protein